jgi:uncharacterized protein GlcG (DUF336 family)
MLNIVGPRGLVKIALVENHNQGERPEEMRNLLAMVAAAMLVSTAAFADDDGNQEQVGCSLSADIVNNVQSQLANVVTSGNGGIFTPNRMWSAVVDRQGRLCSVIVIGDAWPYSRAIAIAKAGTANGFSNDALALSTANLYSAVQPGGSLYGLNNSNPFNPEFLARGEGHGRVDGGVITFGGGVALYSGGKVIGGLGVSGDSSCADHAIAYKMRRNAGLDGIPSGVGLNGTDNIVYLEAGEAPNGFKQPHCFPSSDITP